MHDWRVQALWAEVMGECPCTVDALLSATQTTVRTWTADGAAHRFATMSPEAAGAAYDVGASLAFEPAGGALRQPWLRAVEQELGLHQGDVVVTCWASRAGKGTPRHFDQHDNLTVQVAGSKRWWVGPRPQVDAPGRNVIDGQRVHHELDLYCSEDLAAGVATEDAVDLVRGAVLYHPAGVWHRATTLEDSVALTFELRRRSWVDAILPVLRRRLLAEDAWRAAVPRSASEGAIAERLGELPGLVAQLVPADVRGGARPVPDVGAMIVRNRVASLGVPETDDPDVLRLAITTDGRSFRYVDLDPSLWPAVGRLRRIREPRPLSEVYAELHAVTDADVAESLVGALLTTGYLQCTV